MTQQQHSDLLRRFVTIRNALIGIAAEVPAARVEIWALTAELLALTAELMAALELIKEVRPSALALSSALAPSSESASVGGLLVEGPGADETVH